MGGSPSGDFVSIRLMVDTGAQRTFIAKDRLRELGLVPVRFEEFVGLNGQPEEYPVYLARFEFGISDKPMGHAQGVIAFDVEAVGMPTLVPECGHQGLIGRDVLSQLRLVYDGPKGAYFLEVPGAQRPPKAKSKSKSVRQRERAARRKNRT